MAVNKKNLLLLFDRPNEPVFLAKNNEKTVFEIPDNFYTDRYRAIGQELSSRVGEDGGERIPVSNISIPNLSVPESLGRHEQFSLFIPRHRRIAGHLIQIFMGNLITTF